MSYYKHYSPSLLTLVLIPLIFTLILAEPDQPQFNDDSSSVKPQLDQFKFTLHLLETRLEESNLVLRTKDDKIAQLEVVNREQSDVVASLQSQIEAAQKKGTSDAEDRVGKANARVTELQKQVEKLKKKIEAKDKVKEALEVQIKNSDKRIEDLISKIDMLQKLNDEQKSSILKSQQAIQVAEYAVNLMSLQLYIPEEMKKAWSEANTKRLHLKEVTGSWLPPWLLDHILHSRSFVEAEWSEHGKPVMEILIQKTLEKKGQAEKWAEPHIETIKTKLVPAVKEQWVMMTEYVEPRVQLLTAKTVEAFEASKTAVKPHIIRVQELADPYYQEVKRASKPYIDQVATVTKPHVEKARTMLKPYTKKALHVYGKILELATTYHDQVQAAVHKKLEQHEVSKALATKELTWFAASIILALPAVLLSRICSAMLFTTPKKPSRNSHAHHSRRKGKRAHTDK